MYVATKLRSPRCLLQSHNNSLEVSHVWSRSRIFKQGPLRLGESRIFSIRNPLLKRKTLFVTNFFFLVFARGQWSKNKEKIEQVF